MKKIASALLLVAFCAAAEGAWSDWPYWLGPNRDGTSPETGLLRQWPEGGPKLLWKCSAKEFKQNPKVWRLGRNGMGLGTPTISKGQVFVIGRNDDLGTMYWCFDAFTGKEIWKYGYEWTDEKLNRKVQSMPGQTEDKIPARIGRPTYGRCPKSSIAATDDYVYGIDDLGIITCLDRRNGKKIWSRDLDTEYKPSHNDWKGWCMTPLIIDGVIVISLDQFYYSTKARVAGLDARTGKTIWIRDGRDSSGYKGNMTGASHYQTPSVVDFGGQKCAFFTNSVKKANGKADGAFIAFRPRDGKIIWQNSGGLGNLRYLPSPVVHEGGFISAGSAFGHISGYQISHTRPPFGIKKLWASSDIKTPYAQPMFHKGYFYIFHLHDIRDTTGLVCVDAKTGKIAWREKNVKAHVSMMLADGLLFIRMGTKLVLAEATPQSFQKKGELDLGRKAGGGWIMPSLAYGRLYVRTDKELLCYQVAKELPTAAQVARSMKR